ncbi:hypothetical protein [Oleidesulfovibrio sp.]|uniref:hypothetical protein n=1 Tax=Oleidesulfovibrio sp. TaxID=2909707 RepID=UPI003A8BD452
MNEIPLSAASNNLSAIATLVAGVMTAAATIIAVMWSNKQTRKELIKQEERHAQERKAQFEQSKHVTIRPNLILTSFFELLDRLLVTNNYERVLLFSGDDGFEFYDNQNLQVNQTCRILKIANNSSNDIVNIQIKTYTTLYDKSIDKKTNYETTNHTNILRSGENILIRVANQEQFHAILEMNKNSTRSELIFECLISYTTLANQRITYQYEVAVQDDRRIEVKKDGIEHIESDVIDTPIEPSVFRNLQDSVSSVDRNSYYWQKVGEAQARGVTQFHLQQNSTSNVS